MHYTGFGEELEIYPRKGYQNGHLLQRQCKIEIDQMDQALVGDSGWQGGNRVDVVRGQPGREDTELQ